MPLWLNDGKLVIDSQGRLINCPHCPCEVETGTGTGTGTGTFVSVPCCPGVLIPTILKLTITRVSDPCSCPELSTGTYETPITYGTGLFPEMGARTGWATDALCTISGQSIWYTLECTPVGPSTYQLQFNGYRSGTLGPFSGQTASSIICDPFFAQTPSALPLGVFRSVCGNVVVNLTASEY